MSVLKSPMQQIHERFAAVPSSGFGGSVSHPGLPIAVPSAPAKEQTKSKISDIVVGRLYELKCDGEWLARREELVQQLMPLLELADTLESTVLEIRNEALSKESAKIRLQCRAQLKLLKRLDNELAAAELALMRGRDEQEFALNALRDLGQLEHEHKHVPAYATDEELEAWSAKVEVASDAVRAANQEMVGLLQTRNAANLAIEPQQKIMDDLAATERRLRCELSGEPFVDLATGLQAHHVMIPRQGE